MSRDAVFPASLFFGEDQDAGAGMFLAVGGGQNSVELQNLLIFFERAGIHDESVAGLLAEALQGSGRITRKEHAIAQLTKILAEQIAEPLIAFDDKDSRLRGRRLIALSWVGYVTAGL